VAEEMGDWRRHREDRCRKCSIITGVNKEGYCKKHWGEKILEHAQAEQQKETDVWLREKEKKRIQDEPEKAPPTISEVLADHEKRLAKIERQIRERWGMGGTPIIL